MNLLNKLIEQAKNPNGIIGSLMLKIMNNAHSEMIKWVLRNTKIRDDSTVLDIGCGGGKTIQLLSEINTRGKIYGIDHSEKAVKDSIKANKNGVATGRVHIQQASVPGIPFPGNSFDIITAFQTHYFWPDLENSIREIFKVLKVDGCLVITPKYTRLIII